MSEKPPTAADREPVHPGVHLDEFIHECGFGRRTLARALNMELERLEAIIGGNQAIDADLALRLGAAFAELPTAEFWLGLQASYDLSRARHTVPREVRVLHQADIPQRRED